MEMITVKYYGMVRHMVRIKAEQFEGDNVEDIIGAIMRKHGDDVVREIKRSFILINGKNVALLKGHKTSVKSGDNIQIMTITGGG